jgi:hypothetical protein
MTCLALAVLALRTCCEAREVAASRRRRRAARSPATAAFCSSVSEAPARGRSPTQRAATAALVSETRQTRATPSPRLIPPVSRRRTATATSRAAQICFLEMATEGGHRHSVSPWASPCSQTQGRRCVHERAGAGVHASSRRSILAADVWRGTQAAIALRDVGVVQVCAKDCAQARTPFAPQAPHAQQATRCWTADAKRAFQLLITARQDADLLLSARVDQPLQLFGS